MKRNSFLILLAAAVLSAVIPARADDGSVIVIANAPLRAVDAETIKRIYTGRTIELDGQTVRALNLAPGNPLRRRFIASVLQQDDDDYVAYWTVRRYVGKGVPPREFASSAELIEAVRNTPGAIGYIDASELKPGMIVLLRR
jgi:ABC-type phosphate transport system substrate-binding protein